MPSREMCINAYNEGRWDAIAGKNGQAMSRGWTNSDTYTAYYRGFNSVPGRSGKLIQLELFSE